NTNTNTNTNNSPKASGHKEVDDESKQEKPVAYQNLLSPDDIPFRKDKEDMSRKESMKDPYDVDMFAGYLWKQSTNVRKDWKRRWFVVESGELAYYRSKDNMVRELVVDTMLCKVKERFDHELKFVFELISPSRRVYTLQAENEKDFIAWTSVLKNQVHRLLRRRTLDTPKSRTSSQLEVNKQKHTIKNEIQANNPICADCGKKEPEWVSINMGVMVCISCSGVHRSLGTHVSKIRSISLDDIHMSTLTLLHRLGNERVNKILEHTIPSDYEKCNSNSAGYVPKKFCIQKKKKKSYGKYMFKLFINPASQKSHEELNNLLLESTKSEDLLPMLEAICQGANVDCVSPDPSQNNRTPLHIATLQNKPVALELLLQNGASQSAKDKDGKTARELALDLNLGKIVDILELHDPSSHFQKESGNQSPTENNDKDNESDHEN
ncbi:hypothetical protein RFI_28022, partial [Reticulomyxa filosa]